MVVFGFFFVHEHETKKLTAILQKSATPGIAAKQFFAVGYSVPLIKS